MKPMPRRAFAEVSGFEAKKHNIRQTTDGLWQLTLTVSEFGNADWLVFAPVGLPMAIGIKALDYDNPEEEQEDNDLKKYVTKAVMLCKNEEFQKFLEQKNMEEGTYSWGMGNQEIECSNALKSLIGLSSRADLKLEGDAYDQKRRDLDNLIREFQDYYDKNAQGI